MGRKKGDGKTPDDPPMSPADQAIVDDFYKRNRDRMDKGNPNYGDTRERRQEARDNKLFRGPTVRTGRRTTPRGD